MKCFFQCALVTLATLWAAGTAAAENDFATVCAACASGDADSCALLYASDPSKTNYDCQADTCDDSVCGLMTDCFESMTSFASDWKLATFAVNEEQIMSVKQDGLEALAGAVGIEAIGTFASESEDLTARDCQTLLQFLTINKDSVTEGSMTGTPIGFVYDGTIKACMILAEDGEAEVEVTQGEFEMGPLNCKASEDSTSSPTTQKVTSTEEDTPASTTDSAHSVMKTLLSGTTAVVLGTSLSRYMF